MYELSVWGSLFELLTCQLSYNGMDAILLENLMEDFHSSALGLQKRLLNLRHELAKLDVPAQQEKADHLAVLIAQIERALAGLPGQAKSHTLQ